MLQKVVVYCRVSSKTQVSDGCGLETQEAECRTWAERNGYVVENVYKEEAISGGKSKEDRPAYKTMVKFLRTKKESYIVVAYDISRIARDTEFFYDICAEIQNLGHQITTVHQDMRIKSPESNFLVGAQALMSQFQKEQNARRATDGTRNKLNNGEWIMNPATGYKRVKIDKVIYHKRLEPDATFIKEALEGFAYDRFHTKTDVFNFLKTKKFSSKIKISLNFVCKLLNKQVYTGWFEYPKWGIPYQKWKIEPIIKKDVYDAIQHKLHGDNIVKPHSYNQDDEIFPLRRWLLCEKCKKPLTGSKSRGKMGVLYPYYHCNNKECELHSKSIRVDEVHEKFEELLKEIAPERPLLNVMKLIITKIHEEKQQEKNECYKRLEKDKKDLETECGLVYKKYISETEPDIAKMCKQTLVENKSSINEITQKLQNMRSKKDMDLDFAIRYMELFMEEPLNIWKTGTYEQKRCFLNLCFGGKIVYSKKNGYGTPCLSPIFRLTVKKKDSSVGWCG